MTVHVSQHLKKKSTFFSDFPEVFCALHVYVCGNTMAKWNPTERNEPNVRKYALYRLGYRVCSKYSDKLNIWTSQSILPLFDVSVKPVDE